MSENFAEQIKDAKKGNGILFGSNREIRRLPVYLHEGEIVHKIITGSPGKNKGRGIIVATSERLFFIKDGWVFRTQQAFPYDTLSSVEFQTGIFFGKLTVFGKGDEVTYEWVGRNVGAAFTKLVRSLNIESRKGWNTGRQAPTSPVEVLTAPVAPVTPRTPQEVLVEQIKGLKDLYETGAINADEYEIKRQELLERY